MNRNKLTKKMYPMFMLLPAAIIYLVLFMLPNMESFYYSFTNWNAYSQTVKFVGLDNFKMLFSDSAANSKVFLNTIIFAVCTTVFKIIFGLILALILNQGIRTRNVLRAIFYMPITICTVLLGFMFVEIYSPDGLLNSVLGGMGLSYLKHSWITNPKTAIWACSAVEIWRASGFAMAVFLAALQMIPKEIYEAAELDGVNPLQRLYYIIMPYLYQSVIINTLLGIISGLKVFDLIYVLTNGGPGRLTEVLNVTVLNEFAKGNYGYSTSMGMLLFVFITAVYFGINAIFKRYEVDVS